MNDQKTKKLEEQNKKTETPQKIEEGDEISSTVAENEKTEKKSDSVEDF